MCVRFTNTTCTVVAHCLYGCSLSTKYLPVSCSCLYHTRGFRQLPSLVNHVWTTMLPPPLPEVKRSKIRAERPFRLHQHPCTIFRPQSTLLSYTHLTHFFGYFCEAELRFTRYIVVTSWSVDQNAADIMIYDPLIYCIFHHLTINLAPPPPETRKSTFIWMQGVLWAYTRT